MIRTRVDLQVASESLPSSERFSADCKFKHNQRKKGTHASVPAEFLTLTLKWALA